MFEEIYKITKMLCDTSGSPGDEKDVFEIAKKELAFIENVSSDEICGVYAFFGDRDAKEQIMLDAHIDQIAMIVTEIDEDGFLHITNLGGINRLSLPGSLVTVYGKKEIKGIVSMLPPHISGGKDKVAPTDEQMVDIGLSQDEAKRLVSVGDRIVLTNPIEKLIGNRVGGTALDDRAGCACLIRAAQLLKDKKLNCGVHLVLSTKEEVGGQGATTYSYRIKPSSAIAVDVSFAKQSGVSNSGLGELGKGPMIGFAPILNTAMGKKLVELSEENNIPYQLEAMGGRTGTNCDGIVTSRNGVKCSLISIPQRNMHTPSEICDLEDMENISKLIATYILSL